MFDPIYSLPLLPTGNPGEFTPAAKSSPGGGSYGGWFAAPLGGAFADFYRKDPAPTPGEVIRQLVGIAYACADLNASAVASTRIRLYRRTAKGQKKTAWKSAAVPFKAKAFLAAKARAADVAGSDGELDEITDPKHPLLALLNHPEPSEGEDLTLSAYDHRYVTQIYLESMGRAYWYTGERDGLGVPRRLPLLRSHLMREVPDASGSRVLSHYEYGGANGIRFEPDEICKIHIPDPFHPHLNGYGPLMAAIEKIRIGRKEDAHINALLDNMGRPDAIWSPKGDSEGGGVGVTEAARMRSAFRQAFSQAGRGGVMVSEVPGSLDILGWKPQDVVELERAAAIKNDVMNVFGVPNAKLERNSANLASAKTADVAHAKDTIRPRCTRLEEAINDKIVPLFDDSGRLFVAFDSPVPDDEEFALELAGVAGKLGHTTFNEGRAALGLAPIDGPLGDCRTIDKNLIILDPSGKVLESALPQGATKNEPDGNEKPEKKPREAKAVRERLARAGYSEDEIAARGL